MDQYHGIALLVSIQIKLSNNSKEDTFRSRMANELGFTRPFLKNINLQSRHLPRLPFRTWFSMKENWHLPRRQLNYIPTQPLINLYVPTTRIAQLVWFNTTTTLCFPSHNSEHVLPQISSPRSFLGGSFSQLRASNAPNRPTEKKVALWSPHSPRLLFLLHKNPPHSCLIAKKCHFKPIPLCQS